MMSKNTWKTQLLIAINSVSEFFKDNDGQRVMHSKSDNIEIKINDKRDEVIEKIFRSLLSSYQLVWVGNINKRKRFQMLLCSFIVLQMS